MGSNAPRPCLKRRQCPACICAMHDSAIGAGRPLRQFQNFKESAKFRGGSNSFGNHRHVKVIHIRGNTC